MIPNIGVSITGESKAGKTHLSLTFPSPIVIYSFDIRGAEILLTKPEFKDKQIEIKKFMPPIAEALHPEPYAEKFWMEIKKDYKEMMDSGLYKTVVIDPATILWEVIRHSWTEESDRRQLLSRDYGEPNARMTWALMAPLTLGMNVVSTQYLRTKYVDDKATEELELDGFKRTEGLLDVAIGVEMITKKEKGKPTSSVVMTIKRNRFDRDLNGFELIDATYSDLISLLGVA